ncbi:ATP-dependent Clp protease ATP-binding subunit [Ligilactobacillus murinus]|uniref:ATP-dependent Clp protease ATP-binding subunit n=1 Tax=Ligilactobacillus murinus TaxID=1622 RepID=A0AAD0KY69_9LACO|nr:ATP-dependent Clp protease ATP-binding subunit [Ligilactobacillus murinus]AWZ38568.1 ATP-dependent Clp protease ATP-binding subunit [Ligilactobacillus murinus]AWZ40436.1 ATP-dependent Clp protease ATP-binding subunit [Ligilactobacillus murinus]HCM79174.1 ATP-dependent Clp protease ATP-binding subunit [Lactobacillus sp.]
MLCQNCQQNHATLHLTTNINGRQTSIDLCPNCYRALKNQSQLPPSLDGIFQDPLGSDPFADFFKEIKRQSQQRPTPAQGPQTKGGDNGDNEGILDKYGLDLTAQAKAGQIDPVIGRDREIKRVTEILNRRTKNNPVLTGEAGVGKTAVVEGLAQKIVDGDVPQKLLNKKVIRLDVVSLVQGTGIRGQFEQRMQELMDELKQKQDIILFIDEIHEIVGAGNAEGGMDAGNVLKPALARGEFQLVGATTLNEFRTIEKDAALARRLQPVQVEEPSKEEALAILHGLRAKYESYHQVAYTDEALESAIQLSTRYIQDRYLPDKAIDLLDEAGSRKNLALQAFDPSEVKAKIAQAQTNKKAALDQEDYEKAAFYRDQIAKLEEHLTAKPQVKSEVTAQDMEKIVEEMTSIPVGELKQKEQAQLQTLAQTLKQNVIGQDRAVDKVARSIRRNRIGFNKSGRPIGSFLFVGPTGVGKTEAAKQLALELFGTTEAMIRFDMSEYMEKFSVSKLIGSPPGYVGYEEAGQLTEQVRRHPYSLILLDEIEKAHPDVMHMFLQILDDGRLTDSQGKTVSFKDTIIIMTSNAGSGDPIVNVGFGTTKSTPNSVVDKLTKYFKPEFLNRFDDIIEFNALTKENLDQIVSLMLEKVDQTLQENGMSLKVSTKARQKLVELGYDPKMGARPLRRTIQDQIEDKVTDFYLDHPQVKNFYADLSDDTIVISEANVTE